MHNIIPFDLAAICPLLPANLVCAKSLYHKWQLSSQDLELLANYLCKVWED